MEITGSYTFNAPIPRVWDLLTDPNAVAQCMPGCEKLEPLGDDRYQVAMSVGIAAIKGRYQGTIAIVDKEPTGSYRLLVDGSGGPGFVRGEGAVTLTAQGDKTKVEVQGDLQVGGVIARVGQRVVGMASKMMMDRFFNCMSERDQGGPAQS